MALFLLALPPHKIMRKISRFSEVVNDHANNVRIATDYLSLISIITKGEMMKGKLIISHKIRDMQKYF